MPFRPVEYVVFDMDGLLIDSERVYTEVTNTILSRYGKSMTWAIKAGIMGKPEREATAHLLSHFPSVPLTVDAFIDESQSLKTKLFQTVQPLPGALRLLTHLHTHHIPIAVATSSKRSNYITKTGHLKEMFDLFEGKVVCADDGLIKEGRGKPCPDIFLVAATLLGKFVGMGEGADITPDQDLERKKGLVFEDAIPGVQAALRTGMGVIWVPDENLLEANKGTDTPQVDEILTSLEKFKPERWGLPPFV